MVFAMNFNAEFKFDGQMRWIKTFSLTECFIHGIWPSNFRSQSWEKGKKMIKSVQFSIAAYSNSFFPSTVRAWNDLPNDIKDAPSVGSFKYKINKNLRSPPPKKKKKFYNAGTRNGQMLQARLRMDCSSLNSDLHRKKALYLTPSVGAVSLRVVTMSFLLVRFTHSIDSDICQPILITILAMTFCLGAKINQMILTNPF